MDGELKADACGLSIPNVLFEFVIQFSLEEVKQKKPISCSNFLHSGLLGLFSFVKAAFKITSREAKDEFFTFDMYFLDMKKKIPPDYKD